MRELKIYLNFFNKGWKIILLFGLIGVIVSFFIFTKKEPLYKTTVLYQLEHNDENVEKKKMETDEVVGVLRGGKVNQLINGSDVQKIEVFKPGPVSILVTTSGQNRVAVSENSARVSDFIFSQVNAHILSINDTADEANKALSLLIGLSFGISVGVLIELVRNYARNY